MPYRAVLYFAVPMRRQTRVALMMFSCIVFDNYMALKQQSAKKQKIARKKKYDTRLDFQTSGEWQTSQAHKTAWT